MKYRFQVNAGKSWGADHDNRDKKSCAEFLNEYRDYEVLDTKTIVNDLIEIISSSPYSAEYQEKLEYLKSPDVYKILVVGVGQHDKNEIFLKASGIKCHELAHVDMVEEQGSWMNRLYICFKRPEAVIFYNISPQIADDKHEHMTELEFDEQYAKFEVYF